MIILGIDPGTTIVGYGVIEKNKDRNLPPNVIDFGCIITEADLDTGEKLVKVYSEVVKLIAKHKPDIISIESLFFFKNLKTVMPVGQAKGVILLAAAQKKIPVYEFTPLQMKMAIVGYGHAEKKQVQEMITRILDLKDFDLKKNNRKKDDAFDALGVAVCASLKNFSIS